MTALRYVSVLLALTLLTVGATGAAAKGRRAPHSTAPVTTLCPAGPSIVTFTDRFETGTVAFKTRAACMSFFAGDRGVIIVRVTPTASFMPSAALPPNAILIKLRGNAICALRKTVTLLFTNGTVMVNGQPVMVNGQPITVTQLGASPTTVLVGRFTFANHGACVRFFAHHHVIILVVVIHH